MTDHKCTGDEIIKALECCTNIDVDSCNKCPIYPFSLNMTQEECMETAMSNALDLINRQKAEIERLERIRADLSRTVESLTNESLTNKCADCAGCVRWGCDCSLIESEAIKEFAWRLKNRLTPYPEAPFCEMVGSLDIDALVKEMTEGK